ncbi:MAG TPA: DUF2007 domain-containing protein [Pyrinomonadaceae bacterium]|nr:DUF2007 domain-containing protein [Pyrinomonadaceae bacterium]
MSEEVVVRIFSNAIEAEMAKQLLQDGGIRSFVFKDDAGGMEPHLQLTRGVRLVVNRTDAESAHQILGP